MSKVFFINARLKKNRSLVERMGPLLEAAGLDFIRTGDLTAVKLSFGERGNTAFLRPVFVRKAVDMIKAKGGKPFLTDTNTLYHGSRTDSVDHVSLAVEHGFGLAQTGAPVIMADGLRSESWTKVDVGLKHFKHVKLGSVVREADALVSLAHFKGHMLLGFGGTLKNLGMGLGSRSQKQLMHGGAVRPEFVKGVKCIGCGRCVEVCLQGAVQVHKGRARFDPDRCVGCADCIAACPARCLRILWTEKPEVVGEKTVETACGVLRLMKDKALFVNVILDVSPECDCFPFADVPVSPNIGIVASRDPVAVDQAAADLVNARESIPGSAIGKKGRHEDKIRAVHPEVDWRVHLHYAETIGLGSCSYELVELD